MLGMHSDEAHVDAALQLGPPSVARMTNVLPCSAFSFVASADSVAAVGVPPSAGADVSPSSVKARLLR